MFRNMEYKEYKKGLILKKYEVIGDYGRSKAVFFTDNLEIAVKHIHKGWSLYKAREGFVMEAPDVWMVDLSSSSKVFYWNDDPIINLAYYRYLKAIPDLENYINNLFSGNKSFMLSQGESLEGEIRIIGDNKKILHWIREKMFAHFIETEENNKKYIREAAEFIGEVKNKCVIERNKSLAKYPKKIRELFLEIYRIYSIVNINKRELFSRDYLCGLSKQLDSLFSDIDVIVFVPMGCFDYLSSFLSEKNIEKVMFWEFHAHAYDQYSNKFKAKSLNKKKVLIIDRAYSGRTIVSVSNLVRREGGMPVTLGVFPKSRLAVSRCDYMVFLNKIIPCVNTKDLSIEDIYKQVLNNRPVA